MKSNILYKGDHKMDTYDLKEYTENHDNSYIYEVSYRKPGLKEVPYGDIFNDDIYDALEDLGE